MGEWLVVPGVARHVADRKGTLMRRMCRRWGLLLLALLSCTPVVLADTDAQRHALGVLAEGYFSNRESFRFIDCRFRYTSSRALTVHDALEGRFVGKKTVRHGHWLVNGSNVRYELLCDPDVTKAIQRRLQQTAKNGRPPRLKSETGRVPVECVDRYYLMSSDSYSMSYGPLNLCANLFPKGAPDPVGIGITPFSMGSMGPNESLNPGRFLRDCLSGKRVGRYLGAEEINGRHLLVATVGSNKDRVQFKFGFDPTRGYSLAYSEDVLDEKGERRVEVFLTDAVKCSNGGWFPSRSALISKVAASEPLRVGEITVEHLDVEREPPLERFFLELPRGVQVNVPGEPAWLNMIEDERVGVGDLAKLYKRCVDHGKEYAAKGGAIEFKGFPRETHSEKRWLRIVSSVLAAGVLLGLSLFALARRRRRAA